MSDLISREAAIEAITNYAKFLWDNYHETCDLAGMIDAIDTLPTIDPVKHGEWVRLALDEITFNLDTPITYYDHVQCSCCGRVFPKVLETMNYCGKCGARMKGEEG